MSVNIIKAITLSACILPFLFGICVAQKLSKNDYETILHRTNRHAIIGLGEAEHFYEGYYQTKIELVKYLIQHESIDVIALEASVNATALLDEYIHGNMTIDLPQTLTALNEPYALQKAGLYNCSEIVEFVEWLKDYNHAHRKTIKLVGMDFQNYSLPLEKLKAYSTKHQIEMIDQTKALLDSSMCAIIDSNIMVITSPAWIKRLQLAQHYIKNLKHKISDDTNNVLFKELKQFATLWDNPSFPRDSIMFENLTQHIDGTSRVLIWAANFHLEKDPFFKGPKKLGVFLNEKYGEQYGVMGVSDQTEEHSKNLIYVTADEMSDKYDMIINVPKGRKCVMIN